MQRPYFLILLVLVAATFFQVRQQPFSTYDDTFHVTNNPYLQPPSGERVWFFWRYPWNQTPVPGVRSTAGDILPPHEAIYTPLTFTTWAALTFLARDTTVAVAPGQPAPLDASVFHSFSLLLHVACALVLYQLLLQVVRRPWCALAGALLFALHPVQVEVVAWVTAMNNLLATFWALLGLWFYAVHVAGAPSGRVRPSLSWVAGLFCFALAGLAKPSTVVLPALAFLLGWALTPGAWRQRALELLPWCAVTLVLTRINQGLYQPDLIKESVALWQRPFIVADSLAFYLGRLVWPVSLAADYGRKASVVLAQPTFYLHGLLPLALAIFTGVGLRRGGRPEERQRLWRWGAAGVAAFFLTLLPVSGLVPYYFHETSIVADRYLYLALVPLSVAVAAGLDLCQDRTCRVAPRLLPALCGLVAVLWVALTWKQVAVWSGEEAFWRHTLQVYPRSKVALTALAQKKLREKDYAALQPLLERGLELAPTDWNLLTMQGQLHRAQKRPDEAIASFTAALNQFPGNVGARLGLGQVLESRGDYRGAREQYALGLQINPDLPGLLARHGHCSLKLGEYAEADTYLRRALAHEENGLVYAYLGQVLLHQGKLQDAEGVLLRALELAPGLALAHETEARLLERQGKLDAALAAARQAVSLGNYQPAAQTLQRLERQKAARGAP